MMLVKNSRHFFVFKNVLFLDFFCIISSNFASGNTYFQGRLIMGKKYSMYDFEFC